MQCSDESEPLLTLQERSDLINSEFSPPYVSCDPKLLSIFVVAFDTRAGIDTLNLLLFWGIGNQLYQQVTYGLWMACTQVHCIQEVKSAPITSNIMSPIWLVCNIQQEMLSSGSTQKVTPWPGLSLRLCPVGPIMSNMIPWSLSWPLTSAWQLTSWNRFVFPI